MNTMVFVIDGAFDTGLSTVLDTLGLANEVAPQLGEEPPFNIQMVGVSEDTYTDFGLKVPTVKPGDPPDLLILPALGAKMPEALAATLQRDDVQEACEYLRHYQSKNVRLAAACTSTYVLAASGVLDGLPAATSWWLSEDFVERFPAVVLDNSQMVVETDTHITAGAALAHVDLALWLVRKRNAELARMVARFLLIDARPSQTLSAMQDYLQHADDLVDRFERWARDHLSEFSVARAVQEIGTTERTLQRRLHKALGITPIAFVQKMRIEQAIHQLRTTSESVDDIAESVGYQDGVTLRTLLRRKTGQGIKQIRQSI